MIRFGQIRVDGNSPRNVYENHHRRFSLIVITKPHPTLSYKTFHNLLLFILRVHYRLLRIEQPICERRVGIGTLNYSVSESI